MPIFNYKSKDKYGVGMEGTMDAPSAAAVSSRLTASGFIAVNISESEPGISANLEDFFARFTKIKAEEMIVFTRQLASILGAGVPLLESLEALYEQMTSRKFRQIILGMRHNIESGSSFSEAMEKEKKTFSSVFVAMVKAGERAGILGEVLDRLAVLLERDFENVQKIKSATRYPMMVVIALVIAFIIVVTFVIPRFSQLYANFKTQLPLPTRILLGINWVIRNYFIYIVLVAALAVYLIKKFMDTEVGKTWWDRFSLSVPVFGVLVNKLLLARFARMLSAMLKSGIPILEALTITRDTMDNRVLAKVINTMKDDVTRGINLSAPMRGSKVFPPLAIQMVAIGEKAGALESMLNKVADYFDRDADYMIRNLTPLLEPLLLLLLAFLVTILALGVFLPMWDMVKLVKMS